jgi:hypothetical protein
MSGIKATLEGSLMRIHASITTDRILAAVEDSMFGLENAGFCHACGEDADGCEPDARNYECEVCGKCKVFGAEETLLMTTPF